MVSTRIAKFRQMFEIIWFCFNLFLKSQFALTESHFGWNKVKLAKSNCWVNGDDRNGIWKVSLRFKGFGIRCIIWIHLALYTPNWPTWILSIRVHSVTLTGIDRFVEFGELQKFEQSNRFERGSFRCRIRRVVWKLPPSIAHHLITQVDADRYEKLGL